MCDLDRISAQKPVVMLKGGRTAAGAHAVSSHTGALAGSGRMADGTWGGNSVFTTSGTTSSSVISARSCPSAPPMEGDRVAITTPAGRYGVMAADSLDCLNGPARLRVADLAPDTVERLRGVLLPFASPLNPVDITAACSDETHETALDILTCAPEVDAILVVAFFAPEGISSRLVNIIATKNRQSRKPMVVFSLYGPFTDQHLLEFHDRGVAAFGSMSRAVEPLLALRERKVFIEKRRQARPFG